MTDRVAQPVLISSLSGVVSPEVRSDFSFVVVPARDSGARRSWRARALALPDTLRVRMCRVHPEPKYW